MQGKRLLGGPLKRQSLARNLHVVYSEKSDACYAELRIFARQSRAQRATGSWEAGSGSAVFGTSPRMEGVATMARVARRMSAAAA